MSDSDPSFFSRIGLAFGAFFGVLLDAGLAGRVQRLRRAGTEGPPVPVPPILKESGPEAALQLLGLLQRDGRFIDFIEEDVAAYSDADIGAATRVVHAGCRKVLHEHFTLQAVRTEPEGSVITLEDGFDASAIRLTGNVVGQAPFRGSLAHRGWRVTQVRLPKLAEGHDARVVAPAEVEL
jgi:hypothetical protein